MIRTNNTSIKKLPNQNHIVILMEQSDARDYLKAGKVLKETLDSARKHIKTGQKLLEIADRIEKQIIELEAKPAFPVNLSINNNAAHCTPSIADETILEKDVLKVDAGVQINGCIADSAITLDFNGEFGKMIEANELALENALSVARIGAEIRIIGEEIENTLKSRGFQPIQNLSGHTISKNKVHSGITIPSIANRDNRKLEDEMIIAIEPFACNGKGMVKETSITEIYEFVEKKPTRNQFARKLLEFVEKEYSTMPFCERWISEAVPKSQLKISLRELLFSKSIRAHPILREEQNTIVSQAENTVMLFDGKETILV